MSTTTLFVELLIVGVQVAIWLALLVLSLFGYDWVDLQQAKGWETIIAFLAIPIVYPLGIFIDELADWLLSGWQRRIRDRYRKDKRESVMALLMRAADTNLAEFYRYVRIRMRLSRSTALNAGITAVVAPIFVVSRVQIPIDERWPIAAAITAFCGVLSIIALIAWSRFAHNFYERRARGWETVAHLNAARVMETLVAPDKTPPQDTIGRGPLPKADEQGMKSLF